MQIFAWFLPQFHSFPENDDVFGKGYTEWDGVKTIDHNKYGIPVNKPLSSEEGGLGYYNLLELNVRKRQSELGNQKFHDE